MVGSALNMSKCSLLFRKNLQEWGNSLPFSELYQAPGFRRSTCIICQRLHLYSPQLIHTFWPQSVKPEWKKKKFLETWTWKRRKMKQISKHSTFPLFSYFLLPASLSLQLDKYICKKIHTRKSLGDLYSISVSSLGWETLSPYIISAKCIVNDAKHWSE